MASPVTPPQQAVVPPSQDPFYRPPPGFEHTPPGTILRHRTLAAVFNSSTSSIQLLARSTDSQHRPDAVITTILVPSTPDASKLLSVQEPYNAPNVDCSPSYSLRKPGGDFTTDTVIQSALEKGWYVSVPDHEGFEAAFGNGQQEGRAVLDTVRAALNSQAITGIDCEATVLLQGYSGGSIASEWATELQPTYAPELRIAGAALGGTVPDAVSLYRTINGTQFAGLVPLSMIGVSKQVPGFKHFLDELLVPEKAALFYNASKGCYEDAFAQFYSQDMFSYFKGGDAFLTSKFFTETAEEYTNAGGHGTPQVPLYVYKGVADDASPVADTDALVSKFCADGARIQYVRNANVTHLAEMVVGEPGAFAWLEQRMEGVPVAAGCNTVTV